MMSEPVDLRTAILGPTPSREDILDRIEGEQIRFINLQFTDVMGIVKSTPFQMKKAEPKEPATNADANRQGGRKQ